MNNSISEQELREILLKVNTPGRYTGGEFGSITKEHAVFRIALCFPDLYEIGMSNQAVKILYEMINSETEASCERVFSPAPDFEIFVREKNIPLFTLESRTAVSKCDLLSFTVGYELSATNILNVIELSGIPLRNTERLENDPIIIAGGPAITNPVPFGSFIDAVFIGEAEDAFTSIVSKLCEMKAEGAGRQELLDEIRSSEYFWYSGKDIKVKKAVWNSFGDYRRERKLLVPSVSAVQDHGVVEIMRGCPNGCRFCHAGIFYRPYREKSIETILKEVEDLIVNCGYREITLSSLSSGDYGNISELIAILNNRYSAKGISFSFPSMRVNSFTLPLISEISKVRKSGLTFAVETPDLIHQRGLNKEVPVERIIEILHEAKKMGWKKAKFYFMIGLPFFKETDETDAIIDFLRKVGRETKMQLNVNIGTFIPKPHTPFQWSFQLNENQALERISKIRRALPDKFFKVGYQSPFMSLIEGVISRGDEKTGEILINAFKKGARLDAWEEYIDRGIWREVFSESEADVEKCLLEKSVEVDLPWDGISLSVGKKFLGSEYEKSLEGELTEACSASCGHNCGACNKTDTVKLNDKKIRLEDYFISSENTVEKQNVKILFSFTKKNTAVYLSHINVMNIFERAFLRSGIDLVYSRGFNPKPKLEFANPLTLGVESEDEIASIEIEIVKGTDKESAEKDFIQKMNESLPEGMKIIKAKVIESIASYETGKKVKSLMAAYNGGIYLLKVLKDKNEIMQRICDNLDAEPGVTWSRRVPEGDELEINAVRSSEGKVLNIFRFMKEKIETEYPFDYIEVLRKRTFCATENELIEKKINYFDSYE